MMRRRLIECQYSIVPWGEKAKFKRGRIGLIRKTKKVYIITISSNENNKYPISELIEILPAAIKFLDLKKFLFIRQASDEQRYKTMLREINILIKETKLRQNGKSDAIDRLIATIPSYNDILPSDLLAPPPLRARIEGLGCGGLGYSSYDDVDIDDDMSLSSSKASDQNLDSHQPTSVTLICNNKYNSVNSVKGNPDDNNRSQIVYNSSATETKTKTNTSEQSKPVKRYYHLLDNKNLKYINLRYCSGNEDLPYQIWSRPTLSELALTDCNLEFIPKQLEKFSKSLVSLDLSNNKIDKLPRTFCCKMSKLEYLNLNNNKIETIPLEIKFLCRIINLDLSKNNLRMLPSTFSDLKRLKVLNVSYNNLSQLPAFRTEDIRLRELDVSHNPLDGASDVFNTFEILPSIDDGWNLNHYMDNIPNCNNNNNNKLSIRSSTNKTKVPKLFEISLLNIVRCDRLFKLASEESLPRTIVSTMQRDIFKCYRCSRMSILPAYNTTDILDYLNQVDIFKATGNYRQGMTFMKLLCRSCFDSMN